MFLLYLIIIVAVFVLILLIIPIRIRINTYEGKYVAGWPGLLRVGIRQDEDHEIVVNIWIIFVRYSIYPFIKGMEKEETKNLKTKKEKKSGTSLPKWKQIKFVTRIFWQIIKSSKLKEFYLNIDTKNVITNSLLFPAFAIINTRRNVDLNVNYSGNFSLILDVRNRLLNFIIVIIKNLLKRNQ
jgi:hypothetical protein